MTVSEIKNFLEIDAALGTGGQPTERQLHELAREGYEVVINLGLLDPKYCLPDEAGLGLNETWQRFMTDRRQEFGLPRAPR